MKSAVVSSILVVVVILIAVAVIAEAQQPKDVLKQERGLMSAFTIARIATVIMLFLALPELPYEYYTLLRFVVCGTTAYGAYFASTQKKSAWAWAFGIIAVLFNPFIPFHLGRYMWQVVDVVVALLLVVSLRFLREPKTPAAHAQASL